MRPPARGGAAFVGDGSVIADGVRRRLAFARPHAAAQRRACLLPATVLNFASRADNAVVWNGSMPQPVIK
jgi:hypothetical protein